MWECSPPVREARPAPSERVYVKLLNIMPHYGRFPGGVCFRVPR